MMSQPNPATMSGADTWKQLTLPLEPPEKDNVYKPLDRPVFTQREEHITPEPTQ